MDAPYRVLLDKGADRATWLTERRRGLGGSDAATVLGWGGYASPLEVYADKISTAATSNDEDDNEAQQWGRILEAVIAREWARRENKLIRRGPALVQSTRWPWMLASVDRLVVARTKPHDPVAILECKNRSSWVGQEWDDELPGDVTAQTLHYCAVFGLPRAYVACLVGGNQLRTYTLDPTEDMLAELAEAEREWWETHVVGRTLPPLTASASNRDALSRLYPNPDGIVELNPDGVELLRRRAKAFSIKKDACEEVDGLDDEVRLLLGDKVEGHIRGTKFVQWKPSAGQRSCDYDRLEKDFPDAYRACVTGGQPTRRLTYARKELPS
jgi:putative phage-type endonuclease